MTRAVALTIAGSDSSGGAGIQADLKTFSALGVYGASVITALTAQNTTGVSDIHIPPVPFLTAQLTAVTSDLTVLATKTGMLPTAEAVNAVASHAAAHPGSLGALIVDPVIVATSGDRLVSEDAVACLKASLLPRTDLLTPNIAEAAMLLGEDREAETDAARIAQGQRLLKLGCAAVLMKGGHAGSKEATDILITPTFTHMFSVQRVQTRNTHGTGCTLSAAITAELAKTIHETNIPAQTPTAAEMADQSADTVGPTRGTQPLDQTQLISVISTAKSYLTQALKAGAEMRFGEGSGPVDHLARWQP
ncbi:MAG: bifunctional hydroxymethylpyrimidine kinase/phosphomethylpyrimidine kinase [Pseudomonadota bacterium]